MEQTEAKNAISDSPLCNIPIVTDALSDAQQTALRRLAEMLTQRISTAYIFCFAWQEHESQYAHCFTQQICQKRFRADLLLVCSEHEERALHDIQHLANDLAVDEYQCTTLVLRYADAMRRLSAQDPFVCEVFRRGALLYSQQYALPEAPEFICHERLLQKTRAGWRRWFNTSCQFMDCASYCLMDSNFSLAVFMLHQTVEQACKAMLKVMLFIDPCTHSLSWMLKLCSTLAPDITSVFPRDNPEDKALFKLLKTSYNDCRYTEGFTVREQEAWTLYYRVSTLLRIAGDLCNRRIADLEAF